MKRACKISLIIASVILVCGIVIFASGLAIGVSNPRELNEKEYNFEDISAIELDIDASDIKISEDNGDLVRVFCRSEGEIDVSESGGVLHVSKKQKSWWNMLAVQSIIGGSRNVIEIYVPGGFGGEINADLDLGDITVDNISAKSLSAALSAGDIEISHSVFDKLMLDSDLGDVTLSGCSAGELSADLSAGDFEAESLIVDADMSISLSLGDIEIKKALISGNLEIDSSAGDIEIEDMVVYGGVTVDADLGDIDISLLGEGYYFTRCATDLGRVTAPHLSGDKVPIDITNSAGDISVTVTNAAGGIDETAQNDKKTELSESRRDLDGWIGKYGFCESVTHINPDAPDMFRDYNINVYKENDTYAADIYIEGYQILTHIKAKIEGDSQNINFIFDKYLPEDFGNTVRFNEGDNLLGFKKNKSNLETWWEALRPMLSENEVSNKIYFAKESNS